MVCIFIICSLYVILLYFSFILLPFQAFLSIVISSRQELGLLQLQATISFLLVKTDEKALPMFPLHSLFPCWENLCENSQQRNSPRESTQRTQL